MQACVSFLLYALYAVLALAFALCVNWIIIFYRNTLEHK
jgi:hypothetical protein